MQTITRKLKKFFRLRRGFRKTGHYWIQFSYRGVRKWRVAWYNELLEHWQIDGDTREWYDRDFISINERRIPQNWLIGNPSRYWLYILTVAFVICVLSCVIDVYSFINHIVK